MTTQLEQFIAKSYELDQLRSELDDVVNAFWGRYAQAFSEDSGYGVHEWSIWGGDKIELHVDTSSRGCPDSARYSVPAAWLYYTEEQLLQEAQKALEETRLRQLAAAEAEQKRLEARVRILRGEVST